MKRELGLSVLGLLTACSMGHDAQIQQGSPAPSRVSYSLVITRTSLSATEFEQYKLLPAGLFVECGTIQRGRFDTRQQAIEKVPPEKVQESTELAHALFEKLASADSASLDTPGTNSSMMDPGTYTVRIQVDDHHVEARTSCDFVQQGRTVTSLELKRFSELMRALPDQAPCGNEDFYGLARRVQ
jgi:hypothetical protein